MCPGFPEDTSQCERISALLSRVGDKWTVQVVRVLGTGPMRFNALRRPSARSRRRCCRPPCATWSATASSPAA